MPREIKFRGLSRLSIDEMDECGIEHANGWVFGAYLDAYILNGVVEATYEYIVIEQWCPVDPDTVGQFTGLRDKNGKEIYEGDILQSFDKGGKPITRVVVEWSPEGYWGGRPLPGYHYRTCYGGYSKSEIIGNIHENPELLGVE